MSKDEKDTFILITANKGTEILIPQNDGFMNNQLVLKSNSGDLNTFIVSDEDN